MLPRVCGFGTAICVEKSRVPDRHEAADLVRILAAGPEPAPPGVDVALTLHPSTPLARPDIGITVRKGLSQLAVDDRETVTLYRAVGLNEAADIREFGGFRPGPGSAFVEGKWFAESREHAVRWGQAMPPVDRPRPFLIASVTLPARILTEFGGLTRLDGIGPACFVRHGQLSLINAGGTIVLTEVEPQEQRP